MTAWREVQLSDLIEIKHGFAFKGEFFSNQPTEHVLVTPGNFSLGGGFQWGKEKYYSGPIPSGFVLKAGDIIVTMTDLSKEADTLGFGAVVPEAEVRLLHNQRIGKVVPRSEEINSRFLHWVLRTQVYRNEILANYTGSTVKHTSPTKIRAYRFMLPPLEEQHAIAGVLGALDDKIELNRRMNATLEAMARALFRSWFVDFDPVRANAAGDAPAHMDAATAALFPDRFGEDGLPEGWRMAGLDEIADFLNGLALQKYPAVDGEPSLPVIKIAELRSGLSAKTGRASTSLPERYVIHDGDVLFSWSGSLLQKVWVEGPGALNQHLFKVTSKVVPKWFHFFAVDQHMEHFRAIAASKATTMGHIQRHHLSEAKVAVPGDSLFERLDTIANPLFNRAIKADIESRSLAALRDTLLPKLMSGELRVREAEARVAEAV